MDMAGYNILWFFAVVIGTVLLGGAIAWGMIRASGRSRSEKIAAERKTREIYKTEDPGYRG